MFETTNQLYVLFTDMWAMFGGKWGERSHLSICHTWNGRCANTELVILGSRNPPSFRPSHFETEPRLVENTAREHLRLKTLRLSGRIDASQRNLDLDKVLKSTFDTCCLVVSMSIYESIHVDWHHHPMGRPWNITNDWSDPPKKQDTLNCRNCWKAIYKMVSFKKDLESVSSTRRLGLDSLILHTGQAPKKTETYFLQIPKSVLVGGFNPSEKYESQLGFWHSQYMENHEIHVPNHQPDYIPISVDISLSLPNISRDFPLKIVIFPKSVDFPWEKMRDYNPSKPSIITTSPSW